MNLTAETLGVTEAVLKFKLLQDQIRTNVKKGVAQGATMIATRAKENISGQHGHTRHVVTGNLRRSIQTKVGWASFLEVVGIIGTDVPYAPDIEALPDGGYLYPALTEVGKEAYKYVQEEIAKAIKGTTS